MGCTSFRTVVGFLGLDHDRKIGLQALAVSAAGSDIHSIFAGYAFKFPRANRIYRIVGLLQAGLDVLLRHRTLARGVPSGRNAHLQTI